MSNFIKVVVLVLIVGGLASLATYEYQTNRPQAANTVSQKTYSQAVNTMLAHDAVNKVKAEQLTGQVIDLTARNISVCNQLKTLKQTNVACLPQ